MFPFPICDDCFRDLLGWFAGRLTRGRREMAEGYVYFARRGSGDIKIGMTGNLPRLRHRVREVGAEELLGFEWGGRQRESELHLRFRDLRIEGEWFSPLPPLLSYISTRTEPLP